MSEYSSARRAYLTATIAKIVAILALLMVCVFGDAKDVAAGSVDSRMRLTGIGFSLIAIFVHGYHGMILRRAILRRQLETSRGLFSVIRHPMYLCDLFWTLGFVVASGMDPAAFVLWVCVLISIVVTIIYEERYLELKLPEQEPYDDWRASTHRLIPNVW